MVHEANIHIHHLTRVEGHGDITAVIQDGELKEVQFSVVEAPRFFEAFLRDRAYDEVAHLASRICGICAVSHRAAALKAIEAAFDVKVSEQTVLLRRLAFYGEILSSHVLHLYFLVAPDFLGVPSLLHLAERERETIKRAMRLKRLAYDLCREVVGRHTHPVAMNAGGFPFVHDEAGLLRMKDRLIEAKEDIRETVSLFRGLSLPSFERETEYVSLKHPSVYPFYGGDLFSSESGSLAPEAYREAVREYVQPHSTAKYARWNRSAYMVGALSRVNNNHGLLGPFAREAADRLGLEAPCHNPFMNNSAQVVESALCVEEAVQIIDRLLERGVRSEEELAPVHPCSGRGVGAVEAPRGTLFHEYAFDDQGRCLEANLVIPTAQNLGNLEEDLRSYAPGLVDQEESVIERALEVLVRAYDPCISCSTHVVRLERDPSTHEQAGMKGGSTMKESREPDEREERDALCPECGHAFKAYVDRVVQDDKKSGMRQKIECPVCGCGECSVVQPGT
ncbi:MAG: Ni/Fe hydrogenase subunit alpha [Deltaproteobacteria bacterium]|nr:Ni/Fe hydrogenase subunit alpha [Deltaproteobacteria bacterium]